MRTEYKSEVACAVELGPQICDGTDSTLNLWLSRHVTKPYKDKSQITLVPFLEVALHLGFLAAALVAGTSVN